MIIIDYDSAARCLETSANMTASFHCRDDGDVYSMLKDNVRVPDIQGTLAVCDNIHEYDFNEFKKPDERVRVILPRDYIVTGKQNFEKISDLCRGWVMKDDKWTRDDVQSVSIQQQLFSRFGGIIETES